ncbi:hypothetical protein AA0119_g13310 [Alternaria tenuissima]|uniref:Azaphilone pigments biosynthesis cluster protein L N-terminal domain-containing protein n=2 Tax=Alternaria alternata complex TaxID=187734 RepID=A0A4Q4MTJ8_ALTAL|nr:hypothetical protein AA0117_g13118 [Alternaria alternata]RYN85198.1 hypothetical protein AA0119_g13310 [Alternaria tenuissima]RYO00707.1 hypothetical protein AA0121_g13349 [Alternaria tenuissima]RYO45115.1 hypothetical protein AA0116_g13456 [Alternaria tenuissima]
MADPLSTTASVVALVTVTVQSVKSLYETVSRFKGRDKTLQRLQDELQGIIGILDSLKEVAYAEASISTLLRGPIDRCSEVCKEFEESMRSFNQKDKAGFRDWAKLEFMRGDINEFIDTISGYKSTITVGLGTITIRAAKVSQQALDEYNEMIRDTVYELNVHLQRVDEKLQRYPNSNTSTTKVNLGDEKEVTQTCLRICEDAKEFLESLNRKSTVLQDGQNATGNGEQQSFEAQVLTRQALDKNRDSFANIIDHLQDRLQSLILKDGPKSDEERRRLLEDINTSKQCLEVCKIASEASPQKVYKVGEVIADGDSDQVVANTLADLFDVKKAISRNNAAQLVGSMSGEDLRFLAEKRYASRFGAFAPESSLTSHPARVGNTEGESCSTLHQTSSVTQAQPGFKREKASSNQMRKRMD